MILIINGPSGSGKTTLGDYFKENNIREIVSTTTRARRNNEVDGEDYYFITKDEFLNIEMIEESNYNGNLYGVTKNEVEGIIKNNINAYAVLDINGVRKFKEIYGNKIKVIYIKVSKSKLQKRMVKRGDKISDVISRLKYYSNVGEGNNYKYADYIIDNNGSLGDLKRQGADILRDLGMM